MLFLKIEEMDLIFYCYKAFFDTEKETLHGKVYAAFRNQIARHVFIYPFDFTTRVLNVSLAANKKGLRSINTVIANLIGLEHIENDPIKQMTKIPESEDFTIRQLEELLLEYHERRNETARREDKTRLVDVTSEWSIYRFLMRKKESIENDNTFNLVSKPETNKARITNLRILLCVLLLDSREFGLFYRAVWEKMDVNTRPLSPFTLTTSSIERDVDPQIVNDALTHFEAKTSKSIHDMDETNM